MRDPATLPNSQLLEMFKQQRLLLEQQESELAAKDDIIKQLEEKNDDLEQAYDKLWRERFEARSERYISDPGQLGLDFDNTADAGDAAAGLADAVEEADLIPAHRRRKPRKKRDESLPEHLPRYQVTADVPDDMKTCQTHGERTLLPEEMWDKTETLEFEPPVLKVRITKHPKYACPNAPQCGIVSPERPTGIVEGNKYDASVAAEIITGKYSYHLPIYRQQDYFAGSGWAPGRSTLINILAGSFFVIEPLLAYFKRTVQNDSVIGCDDTGVTLLYPQTIPTFDLDDPKERRIHEVFTKARNENKPSIRAKMWAYRGASVKLNVFDFTVSRHPGTASMEAGGRDRSYSSRTIWERCWVTVGMVSNRLSWHPMAGSCVLLATVTRVARLTNRQLTRPIGGTGCFGFKSCMTSKIAGPRCRPNNGWSCANRKPNRFGMRWQCGWKR